MTIGKDSDRYNGQLIGIEHMEIYLQMRGMERRLWIEHIIILETFSWCQRQRRDPPGGPVSHSCRNSLADEIVVQKMTIRRL
jgi:hypothetical protein